MPLLEDKKELRKEKMLEEKEGRKWAEWVERTQAQITREAGQRGGERDGWEGGWTPHPPVHPIPDNDWVGETWGLYFSDVALEDIQVCPPQGHQGQAWPLRHCLHCLTEIKTKLYFLD